MQISHCCAVGLTQLAILGQSEGVQGSVAVQDHGELCATAHLHHRSAAATITTVVLVANTKYTICVLAC